MTGPGPGKIRLRATVTIASPNGVTELGLGDVEVYLHVKGWSWAPVTHIDVEAPGIERELVGGPGRGVYGLVVPLEAGFVFRPFRGGFTLTVRGVNDPVLSRVFRPDLDPSPGFLGGKRGGVFVGFKSHVLRRLEEAAVELYGIYPRRLPRRRRPR